VAPTSTPTVSATATAQASSTPQVVIVTVPGPERVIVTPPEIVLVPVPAVVTIDRAPATPPAVRVAVAGSTPPPSATLTPIPPRTGNRGDADDSAPAPFLIVLGLMVGSGSLVLIRQFVRRELVG